MAMGTRIKQARLLRGWSQRDLADRLPVSDTTVSKYEREKTRPDSAMLMEIADALDVDLSYVLRAPRVASIQPADRTLAAMRRTEENALLERIRDWIERYLEIESILEIDALDVEWPAGVPRVVASMEEVEAAAHDLREAWTLGMDPIENLMERLEDHALRVGSMAAPDAFDACAFQAQPKTTSSPESVRDWAQVDGGIPVLVVNADRPGDRQRLGMARELGRLVLAVRDEVDEDDAYHRFGRAFLVPKPVFVGDVGTTRRIRLRELQVLTQTYGVRMQALIDRMRDLDILRPHPATQWAQWFRSTDPHTEEPGAPVPRERPQRLERMVQRALAEERISERRAAELLGRDGDVLPDPALP